MTNYIDIPSRYCQTDDVEQRWGASNVEKWADVDNDKNPFKIQTRIDWAICQATSRIEGDFNSFIYVIPFNPVPSEVRRHASALAGVELFHCRSMSATNDSATIQRAEQDYNDWKTSVFSGIEIPGAVKR